MFAEQLACLKKMQSGGQGAAQNHHNHAQHPMHLPLSMQQAHPTQQHLQSKRRSQLRSTLQSYRQETQATERQLAELEQSVAAAAAAKNATSSQAVERTCKSLQDSLGQVTKSLIGAKTVFEAEINRGVRDLIRDGFEDATTAEYFVSQEPTRLEQCFLFQRVSCHKLSDAIKSLSTSSEMANSSGESRRFSPIKKQQQQLMNQLKPAEAMYHSQPEFRPAVIFQSQQPQQQPETLPPPPPPTQSTPTPPRVLPKPGSHVNPTYDEYLLPPPPPPSQPAMQASHLTQLQQPPSRPIRQPGRPQVAFSNTVKVDDGSEVVRLNWPDEELLDSETVQQQQQQQVQQRTPPPPPPRKSSASTSSSSPPPPP
uniref:Protein PML n=1 Tax=Macrostomum lignano TaxID=282301 RepID=A0A1I8HV05_9PLAT